MRVRLGGLTLPGLPEQDHPRIVSAYADDVKMSLSRAREMSSVYRILCHRVKEPLVVGGMEGSCVT